MSWVQNKGLGLGRRWRQLGGGFGGACEASIADHHVPIYYTHHRKITHTKQINKSKSSNYEYQLV